MVDVPRGSEHGSRHRHGPVGVQVLRPRHGDWMGTRSDFSLSLSLPLYYYVINSFLLRFTSISPAMGRRSFDLSTWSSAASLCWPSLCLTMTPL